MCHAKAATAVTIGARQFEHDCSDAMVASNGTTQSERRKKPGLGLRPLGAGALVYAETLRMLPRLYQDCDASSVGVGRVVLRVTEAHAMNDIGRG